MRCGLPSNATAMESLRLLPALYCLMVFWACRVRSNCRISSEHTCREEETRPYRRCKRHRFSGYRVCLPLHITPLCTLCHCLPPPSLFVIVTSSACPHKPESLCVPPMVRAIRHPLPFPDSSMQCLCTHLFGAVVVCTYLLVCT